MREILFRGKGISTGNWVEGWYGKTCIDHLPLVHSIIPAQDAEKGYLHHVQVNPETVGQYTGMNDRNGQKIFEGDYIRAVLPASKAQREFTWPVMTVVYSRGAFGLEDSHGEVTPLCSFAPYVTFEVVGNIHDSPMPPTLSKMETLAEQE